MKHIAKTAGAVVTSLGLVVGMSAFAGATQGSFGNSGNFNRINQSSTTKGITKVHNNTGTGVLNLNAQGANSGDASVTGLVANGNAKSGDASNTSMTTTGVSVDNSASSTAAVTNTAPASDSSATLSNSGDFNSLSQHVNSTTVTKVSDNTYTGVSNVNLQGATSGDASVSGFSATGNATSGNASNTSTTSTYVTVKN